MFVYNEGEKPLENIITDGGFTSIFRKICCVGDSLSSGEFEDRIEGKNAYFDMYEYSWGQFLGRACGSEVLNFSCGGMTAKDYCTYFANDNKFWDKDKACQCYIIAMGWNDLFGCGQQVGTADDMKNSDPRVHPDTFMGWYGELVRRLKAISPCAKFFFITLPRFAEEEKNKVSALHRDAIIAAADYFGAYVLDMYTYGPCWNDEFSRNFMYYGHLSPTGYAYTSKLIGSYIDWIIRKNPDDFKRVGFIFSDNKKMTGQ